MSGKKQAARYASFEISSVHTYKGRSIHAIWPAVRFEVTVANPELLDSNARSRALQYLQPLLPELEMGFSPDLSGIGQTSTALLKILFAEISAATTYVLMRRVAEWINPLSSRPLDNSSGFDLVCEYRRSPGNASEAVRLALELLEATLRPIVDEEALRHKLAGFMNSARSNLNGRTTYFLKEAESRGIPVSVPVTSPSTLGLGCHQKRLAGTDSTLTSIVAVNTAINKVQTANLLRQAGIPVPEQCRVKNQEDAIAAGKRIGYPVVVKPVDGMKGKGVSVRLTSEDAVASAYCEAAAASKSNSVIVESFIAGTDYRLLVIDGQLVAASQRVPGHVVGNGKSSIRDLLQRRRNITMDFDARRMLEEQGVTPDSIPKKGQIVFLRSKANLSAGGTSIGLTEQVHPDNRNLAIAAAGALQLDIAGIDFITPDISRSYKETGGGVCEVNSDPEVMGLHVRPASGSPVAVASYMLDMLFPPPATGRVPIIAIYGDEPSGCLSRYIANLLQVAGYQAGLATHEGCWIGGDLISAETAANADGARRVLLHPSTSAAVIEVSTESILSDGLGFDSCDVAVITSSFRRLLNDTQQSRAVIDLIQSSSGTLILDDDAPAINAILSVAEEKKLYCIDPRVSAPHGNITRIAKTGEANARLKISEYEDLITRLPGGQSREAIFSIVAGHAIGIFPEVIENSLGPCISLSQHHPLLVSGLGTPFGSVLMATPRTSKEVEIMSTMARSWAAARTLDMIICMSFKGGSDLQAALASQVSTGAARPLDFNSIFQFGINDLRSVIFKYAETRVVILTDNMEFFRKRLKSIDSSAPTRR